MQIILAVLLIIGLHGPLVDCACQQFSECSIGGTILGEGETQSYNCVTYSCSEGALSACSEMTVFSGYDTENCIQVFNYDECKSTLINIGGTNSGDDGDVKCGNFEGVLSSLDCSADGICEPIVE